MRAVIQRVSEAEVKIPNENYSASIGLGFLILLGIEEKDEEEDLQWLLKKIINLRVFSDPDGRMNLALKDVDGQAMVVSQFTLHASTKKGNRPSFIKAAKQEKAKDYYERFINNLRLANVETKTGIFAADMKVSLVNDGPVTIIIDSKVRE